VSLPGRNHSLTVSRVQLALNVTDMEAAVAFYSKLFAAEPAKRRPGYANFAIDEPPLKLVLIESEGGGATLNHLGVEVSSTDEVIAATRRLSDSGLQTTTEAGVECCYALQDKVWVSDPDGAPWEVYTVLAESDAARTPRPCVARPAAARVRAHRTPLRRGARAADPSNISRRRAAGRISL
jgi:catechol 2,3-dioxygenase-like lactoylglutathione lyase family enzyme